MTKTLQSKMVWGSLFLFFMTLSFASYSQTAVTMTLQNAVQVAPNIFEYDMMLTNTGTTTLALRGYSWGINHALGLANGGTITHTYISRDASLASLPLPTFAYTAASLHLRATTINATAGNEVLVTSGVPVRLATMRVTCTANFPSNFDPAMTLQTITAAGKTQCIATCIVTPPGVSYAINGPGNNPVAGTLQLLTGVVSTPCFTLNPNSVTSSATACDSYLWNQNGTTYTASGTYTHTALNGLGCPTNYVLNLTINNSSSSSVTASAFASYTWPVTGLTYTTSGSYNFTTTNAVGCDSIVTLQLTILQAATLMTIQNAVQTAPNVFEYDVMLTNTGTAALSLRGYSWGINHATGMANGGTISHTYLSRDPSLATLPTPTSAYTAGGLHLRGTTINATAGNEVILTAGVPVRLATMRVTCTANFPANFNPAFALQLITAAGKTQCIATCIVTPPGTSFAINGPGNNPVAGTLQVMSGLVTLPCFYLNPSATFAANATSSSSAICFGQSSGTAQITLSGTGSAAPGGTIGTYSVNGGSSISYSGNPFTVTNLAAGTNTITVSTSFGCIDTAVVVTTQQGLITGSSSLSACTGYTWNGTTYTASGSPTHTYVAASGCDSVHTLNLTINNVSAGISSLTACDSYTWNGTTYTLSGMPTHLYTNANGCDSLHTLNLTINNSSVSLETVVSANSYTWSVNSITYTASGTYSTTLLNAYGCDSNLTLNLEIITVTVTADQNVSCFGSNDGTLLASGNGGLGNFVYDLDGANLFSNTTGYFFNITPGTHTICAKEINSNVVVCGSATINEPTPLTATFVVDNPVSCNGSDGELSIMINGGTNISQPYLTLWTNATGDTLNDQGTDLYALSVDSLVAGIYHVRIEDDNACVLNVSTILAPGSCNVTLNLNLFIEGYYTGSSAMTPVLLNQGVSLSNTITDSILVELHDAMAPYAVIASNTAILNTDGTATCLFPPLSGSYYIVIKHRNALQTWSANPIVLSPTVSYNFTTASSQAYGNNMAEVEPGIWALYSGELNADENIDLLDNSILEVDVANFEFGYFATDLNGDGNVDLLDVPVSEANINGFIFSIHP